MMSTIAQKSGEDVLALLVILCWTRGAVALTCYQCSSTADSHCGVAIDSGTTTCTSTGSCYITVTQPVGTGAPPVVRLRGCEAKKATGCANSILGDGSSQTECHCSTDLCNADTTPPPDGATTTTQSPPPGGATTTTQSPPPDGATTTKKPPVNTNGGAAGNVGRQGCLIQTCAVLYLLVSFVRFTR